MNNLRIVLIICLLITVGLSFGCSPTTSEKDIIGKWNNTKMDNMWMEFYADKTSTGGKWSITKEGHIEVVNADGTKHVGILKDGKLIFEEFGDYGIFVKEAVKK